MLDSASGQGEGKKGGFRTDYIPCRACGRPSISYVRIRIQGFGERSFSVWMVARRNDQVLTLASPSPRSAPNRFRSRFLFGHRVPCRVNQCFHKFIAISVRSTQDLHPPLFLFTLRPQKLNDFAEPLSQRLHLSGCGCCKRYKHCR